MNKFWFIVALCLAASIGLALQVGVVPIPLELLWRSDISADQQVSAQILWQLRLPRIALALCAGAALSLSGAMMQSISRNQLADPYLFGLVSGAGVGIALSQLFWPLQTWSMPLAASLGAVTAAFLVLMCVHLSRQRSVLQLLLSGIAISFLLSSVLSLLLYLQSHLAAGKILFWLMGSVANATWNAVGQLFVVLVVAACVLWRYRRELLALSCSESFARSVGVPVGRVQLVCLLIVCALTAVTVSYCGGIALVGLVIPQLCRLLVGSHLYRLLPASALIGGIFLLLTDTVARSALPNQELPLGVVCSGAGAVFFLLLLLKSTKTHG